MSRYNERHLEKDGSPICGAKAEGALTVDSEHEESATCVACIELMLTRDLTKAEGERKKLN